MASEPTGTGSPRRASGWSIGVASTKSSSNSSSSWSPSPLIGAATTATSRRPSRRRRISSSVFSSTMSSSSFGNRQWIVGITCGSRYGASVGKIPRRIVADDGSWCDRATSRMASASASSVFARATTSRPTAVGSVSRVPRSNSVTPSSVSSLWICVDNVGWLTKHASAALPKLRCSASATTYSRSRRFTPGSLPAPARVPLPSGSPQPRRAPTCGSGDRTRSGRQSLRRRGRSRSA